MLILNRIEIFDLMIIRLGIISIISIIIIIYM
jgi:hypothetical protein